MFETKQTVFCSESITGECTPCPEHGSCINGELTCQNGFLRQNDLCVENPWVINAANNHLRDLEKFLKLKRGAYECGNEENYKIEFGQIQQELRTKYGFDHEEVKQRFSFPELMAKIVDLLNSESYPAIAWDPLEENLTPSSIQSVSVWSPVPSFTLRCYLYLSIKENLLLIIGSISVLSYLWYKIKSIFNSFRYGKISNQLYQEVV